MTNEETNNEVQSLAIRLCELYHEKKDGRLSDKELLSDGELRDVRNQLIHAIMRSNDLKPDDSDAWYKICYYVILTIPKYKYPVSEGKYSEFTHFFRRYYKNDFDNIDDEVSDYYISGALGGKRDDIHRVRQIQQYCKSREVNLLKITDETCESIRHHLFHDSISKKKLRMLLTIAVRFGKLESAEAADEEGFATFPLRDAEDKEDPGACKTDGRISEEKSAGGRSLSLYQPVCRGDA